MSEGKKLDVGRMVTWLNLFAIVAGGVWVAANYTNKISAIEKKVSEISKVDLTGEKDQIAAISKQTDKNGRITQTNAEAISKLQTSLQKNISVLNERIENLPTTSTTDGTSLTDKNNIEEQLVQIRSDIERLETSPTTDAGANLDDFENRLKKLEQSVGKANPLSKIELKSDYTNDFPTEIAYSVWEISLQGCVRKAAKAVNAQSL